MSKENVESKKVLIVPDGDNKGDFFIIDPVNGEIIDQGTEEYCKKRFPYHIIRFPNNSFKAVDGKKISELTSKDIEILSSSWALKKDRPNLYYNRLLKETKEGKRAVDELPYFVIKALTHLGYSIN